MKNTISEIMLRRKNQFYISEKLSESFNNIVPLEDISDIQTGTRKAALIFSTIANINKLGYMPTKKLVECWFAFSDEQRLLNNLITLEKNLKFLTGADKTYTPMYPNFPEQVMEMKEVDLYFNAFVHYLSEGTWMPETKPEKRTELNEDITFIMIDVGYDNDVINLFTNLMKSNTSISNSDREDIKTFLLTYPYALKYIPSSIPFKENAVFIAKIIFDFNSIINSTTKQIIVALNKLLKTATDVLRFVTELSSGDVTLATQTQYIKLSRPQRKIILGLLESCNNIEEDMKRYSSRWITLGEILHPNEYKKFFPKTATAFNKLRNKLKIETFNSKRKNLLDNNDIIGAVNLLKNRPGEFARSLAWIISKANDDEIDFILNTFKSVANNISTSLLLQLRTHYIYRNRNDTARVVFPKGKLAKAKLLEESYLSISNEICEKIVKICDMALVANYSTREMLGRVYIAPELKNYIVPFSQRTASDMKKIMTRGSRISLNANYIRAFAWWTNQEDNNRIDIDLSAAFYDKDFNALSHCSFTNLVSHELNYAHSGDITDGGPVDGKGVAEFIDIDLETLSKNNIKYIIFSINNYLNYHFSTMPNCDFGFMARNDIKSGELFEPSTVINRMRVNSDAPCAIPCAIDVETSELIWLDIVGGLDRKHTQTLEGNLVGTTLTSYGIINMSRPTMFDVALLNGIARGIDIVDNKSNADVIFDYDYNYDENSTYLNNTDKKVRLITPYDIDVYMSELI